MTDRINGNEVALSIGGVRIII
ncbi:hypothetical protein [Chryseobacterium sp. P1-3]|nr:hypothetical protein [Chryseobacterium sp. P1-3]